MPLDPDSDAAKMRGGPPAERFTLDHLLDPANMAAFLHKTWDLSDEAFKDLVDDIGTRAARLVLRTKALGGDVRALELYDKITYRDHRDRRQETPKAAETGPAASFVQAPRVEDDPNR